MKPIPDYKLKIGMRVRIEKGPKWNEGGLCTIQYPYIGTITGVDTCFIRCDIYYMTHSQGWYTFYPAEDDTLIEDMGTFKSPVAMVYQYLSDKKKKERPKMKKAVTTFMLLCVGIVTVQLFCVVAPLLMKLGLIADGWGWVVVHKDAIILYGVIIAGVGMAIYIIRTFWQTCNRVYSWLRK